MHIKMNGHKLPRRDASRMRSTIRTSSAELTAPASSKRFLICSALCKTEVNTTIKVVATVFATNGPFPCFNWSIAMITSFLTGVLNKRIRIKAISVNTTVNRRLIMFIKGSFYGGMKENLASFRIYIEREREIKGETAFSILIVQFRSNLYILFKTYSLAKE